MLIANMMVYNELPFLDECLKQLLQVCDRAVVLDNGSTDGSREYLRDTWDTDPRITFLELAQDTPPNYAKQRNAMLSEVMDGDWVLKWDPDELPSLGMKARLKDYLDDIHTGWTVPIFHMMHDRHTALGFEAGFGHLRLFRKTPTSKFVGDIHEQISIGDPWGGIAPDSGVAVVHLSYYSPKRLHRKGAHYAAIASSGFTRAEDLSCRLTWPTVKMPVETDAPDSYLERIRGLE